MSPHILDETRELLGSTIRITVICEKTSEPEKETVRTKITEAFDLIKTFEQNYSRFQTHNQLWDLNEHLGVWQTVSPELFELIKLGEKIKQQTNGAFDLSVKTLLENFGYDAQYSFMDGKDPAFFQTASNDFRPPNEIKIANPLELGGLGKGYALDLIKTHLQEFPNLCIDAGGDLFAQGHDHEANPWKIVFEHPSDPTQGIGMVEVNNMFLAASSPSKRQWKNFHHLVNPTTQQPANNMLGVYTQGPGTNPQGGTLTDAYATALFVMGFEAAQKILPSLPIEAMLISPTGIIHRTPHFQGELFEV